MAKSAGASGNYQQVNCDDSALAQTMSESLREAVASSAS
jgi:hypothetical protein